MHRLLWKARPFAGCVVICSLNGYLFAPAANASHLLPLADTTSVVGTGQPQPGTLPKDVSDLATLHIVAIEGDKAVNVLKKKMTSRVVVRVLDGSNQPVAGALVTFKTPQVGASAIFDYDLRTTTAVTNAEGRVAPPNITAVNPGSFNYQISAMYREQEATATVSQTNVANGAAADAQASQGIPSNASSGAARAHRFPRWAVAAMIGGAAAAAGIGVAVGTQQSGKTVATAPTAVIGTSSGATVGAPH